MSHIKLANSCDAILVAPCTANFLSKMVSGSADDLATNVLLASDKVKIIAPAMNTVMWSNKIVKKNIKDLKKLGVYIFFSSVWEISMWYKRFWKINGG